MKKKETYKTVDMITHTLVIIVKTLRNTAKWDLKIEVELIKSFMVDSTKYDTHITGKSNFKTVLKTKSNNFQDAFNTTKYMLYSAQKYKKI